MKSPLKHFILITIIVWLIAMTIIAIVWLNRSNDAPAEDLRICVPQPTETAMPTEMAPPTQGYGEQPTDWEGALEAFLAEFLPLFHYPDNCDSYEN
ncbi:MAG: hypothetical protein FWE06_00405 [Oscillospiraceae bacterium]|nr:hypothetical protein [Oscillospiraceae bacterium]